MSTLTSNHQVRGELSRPLDADEPLFLGLRSSTWMQAGVIAVLFCLVFWPNLRRLWDKANPITGEDNWKHAFFVPLIGLYYLYVNRDRLARDSGDSDWEWRHVVIGAVAAIPLAPLFAAVVPVLAAALLVLIITFLVPDAWRVLAGILVPLTRSKRAGARAMPQRDRRATLEDYDTFKRWVGIIIAMASLEGGMLLFAYGIWPGQNDYFKDLGMVEALFGVVALTCGWRVMKIAWFPVVFLICALPWPGLFYSMLAGPLQKMAAVFAVRTLNFSGVASIQSGTKIFIVDKLGSTRTLNVAEACSGLRSLMTFISIAAALAFLSFRPLWQKLVMVASAIPVAILCNMSRITVQGIFNRYVDTQWSESFAHGFLGLAMMIPAFFMILLVGWVLQNIFIDEVSDKKAIRSGYTAARRTPTAATASAAVGTSSSATTVAPARKPALAARPMEATPPPRPAAMGAVAPPPPVRQTANPGNPAAVRSPAKPAGGAAPAASAPPDRSVPRPRANVAGQQPASPIKKEGQP